MDRRGALRGGLAGGNTIFANVSLHAKSILGEQTNTLGVQSFLRFGFKAAAGVLLGWLLATSSPRATLMATTSILLVGMVWALTSSGWWFMATFGLLGAGELFGAYFPNYVTSASAKEHVRVNLAYLNLFCALAGFRRWPSARFPRAMAGSPRSISRPVCWFPPCS